MRRIPMAAGLALVALPALAQVPVNTPGPSPHASVTEAVAATEIAVSYSRPAVKGRKIWGGLVPYGRSGGPALTTTPSSPSRRP